MLEPVSTSSSNSNNVNTNTNLNLITSSESSKNVDNDNKPPSTTDQSILNNQLDLNDYMTQYNIAQLVIMENTSNTNNQPQSPHNQSDDFTNLLTGELNNNNPLVINKNVITNTSNCLQFNDCPSLDLVDSLTSPHSQTYQNNNYYYSGLS